MATTSENQPEEPREDDERHSESLDTYEKRHREPPEERRHESSESYERRRHDSVEAHERRHHEAVAHRSSGIAAGGSAIESLAGAGGVVLTILALLGTLPTLLLSIATLCVGVGLMFAGGSLAVRVQQIMSESEQSGANLAGLGGGMSTELIGGTGAAILGLLALLGFSPMVLNPAGAIVLGAAILFGTGATFRMQSVAVRSSEMSDLTRQAAGESISAAAGAHTLVGVGAATLGILALIGFAPMTLTLVSVLTVGSAIMLNGMAISSRMIGALGS